MQHQGLLPAFSFPARLALVAAAAWLAACKQAGLAAVLLVAILLGGIGATAITALLGKSSDKSRE